MDADLFSSLRTPSGLGCSTVLYPEAAALAAAAVFAMTDPILWSRLAVKRLTNWIKLTRADAKERSAVADV